MRNLPALLFFLVACALSMAYPLNDVDNTALYTAETSGGPRAFPQYYNYQDSVPIERRQDEILETAQRVVYTPLFRYRKKQSKQPKRDSYRYRKVNRIMPAYLI